MKTYPIDGELRDKVVVALQKSPWFRGLDSKQLDVVIGLASLLKYDSGETIVASGEDPDSFFLLMKGEVDIEIPRPDGGAVGVGRVKPPFSFGEVGLLLSKPRTASVIAADEVYVLSLGSGVFGKMFNEIPAFRLSVAKALATRLEAVSGMVLPPHERDEVAPEPEVFGMLPFSFVQRHRVVPLSVEENLLTVGFVDDPTPEVMAGLRQHLPGMEFQPVRLTPRVYNRVMTSRVGAEEGYPEHAAEPESTVRAVTVPPLLQGLLERVVAEGASDLHLAPGRRPVWRIDGDIRVIEDAAPIGRTEVVDLFEPLLEERHREEFAAKRDVDLALSVENVGRFRVNLYWTHRGVGAAMRLIPWQIVSLEQLGMPPVLKSFCQQPKGLVLVTGPTGSGKSTTIAAMIDYINRLHQCHIVTLEDPIEFVHSDNKALVDQREVGGHVESFARGLRAALREDPDVVLLGEIRDADTAALALEIANTGHLVFATVHTNSAVSTVERLVDMFPGETQGQARSTLADELRGIVCQTLCKGRTGGRVAAVEVLVGGVAATNLIREGKANQLINVMQTGGKEGNRLLNDDLARLVRDRKILYEEAAAKAVDKTDLARRLGKVKTPEPRK